MSETNILIKKVGLGMMTMTVLWSGFIPAYINRDINKNLNFYFNIYENKLLDILPWFQAIVTVAIMCDIANT